MNNLRRTLAMLAVMTLLLAGCGGDGGDEEAAGDTGEDTGATEAVDEGTATEGTEGDDVSAADADADLVIWADDVRVPPMQEIGQQCGDAEGYTVAVQEVAFEDIRGQLQQAGPAGEGPDVIVGANDWIGELVTNGAISQIELPDPEAFQDVAIEGFTYEGSLVGVPFAVENLALYRNTDLVPEAPETWQEVVDISLELQDSGEVEQAFLLPATAEEVPYHIHPIFTGFGGYYFGQDAGGGYDTSDIGIDSEGALQAGQTVQEWVDQGFINPDVTGQIQQERFGAGEAAFAVSGPWALVQGGAGFQETDVNFAVDPFPTLDGNPMQPFVGVQGIMISAFSENSLLAQSFATECMAAVDAQLTMAEANSRPPALIEANEQILSENPAIGAFGEASENGVLLPALPAMSSVFTALGDAWTLIFQGEDPTQALENAAQTAREAVEGG